MGCGCRGGGKSSSDLEKFAFLTPRQLRLREEQRKAKLKEQEEKNNNG
jgi:hypothetical protein